MNNSVFIQECKFLINKLIEISEKSRIEGILSLEEDIDHDKFLQGNILDVGLRLFTDGVECEFIEKILTNLINNETDEEKKFYGKIVKNGIIAIQKGSNIPNGINIPLLKLLLNSYANIDVIETLQYYKDNSI